MVFCAYKALSNNGNPFGSKGNLSFSGSGETDWGTASFFMFTTDAQVGVSSHSQTLDMGDMGTIGFDQGTGAFGIGTIDEKCQQHTKKYGMVQQPLQLTS